MEGEPLEVSPKTPGCSSLDGATAPGPGGGAESEHAVSVGLNKSERDSEGRGLGERKKGLMTKKGAH